MNEITFYTDKMIFLAILLMLFSIALNLSNEIKSKYPKLISWTFTFALFCLTIGIVRFVPKLFHN